MAKNSRACERNVRSNVKEERQVDRKPRGDRYRLFNERRGIVQRRSFFFRSLVSRLSNNVRSLLIVRLLEPLRSVAIERKTR